MYLLTVDRLFGDRMKQECGQRLTIKQPMADPTSLKNSAARRKIDDRRQSKDGVIYRHGEDGSLKFHLIPDKKTNLQPT